MVVLMLTVLLISLLNTLQHVILVITFLSQKPLGMNILLCVKNIVDFRALMFLLM